jgi:hypothetical protein
MPATFTPGSKIGRISTEGLPPARGERELQRTAELAADTGAESDEAGAEPDDAVGAAT